MQVCLQKNSIWRHLLFGIYGSLRVDSEWNRIKHWHRRDSCQYQRVFRLACSKHYLHYSKYVENIQALKMPFMTSHFSDSGWIHIFKNVNVTHKVAEISPLWCHKGHFSLSNPLNLGFPPRPNEVLLASSKNPVVFFGQVALNRELNTLLILAEGKRWDWEAAQTQTDESSLLRHQE